jgi:uncharacterized lipoprotein YddW (UPF0748 family)
LPAGARLWLNANMQRGMQNLLLLLWFAGVLTVAAAESRVCLVQGTVSLPDAAERAYAKTLALRLSEWLSERGVAHRIVPDEAVAGTGLDGSRVAVLTYNPALPDDERAALIRFMERGGQLVVFYSSDEHLANRMGFRMGPYKRAPERAAWQKMVFNEQAPEAIPRVVPQVSSNIRPVYPDSPHARTIATWHGENGPLPDPAWLQSRHGFWMTHVLLDAPDPDRQQRMLLAILGACDPDIWREAAAKRASGPGAFIGCASMEQAVSLVGNQPRGTDAAVLCLLDHADALYRTLQRQLQAKTYPAAYATAGHLDEMLTRAYAAAQSGRKHEVRGIWDHEGTGLYPGNWPQTCSLLARVGFTDIFSNTLWPGRAHYPSEVVPLSPAARLHGDQLAAGVLAAHKAGLRYHAWKVCWWIEGADPEWVKALDAAGRLQINNKEQARNWLCPSDPRNTEHELATIREVATQYGVDGIHLDYIRYPDAYGCFCPRCKAQFTSVYGRQPEQWPIPPSRTPLWKAFSRWRADQITTFVRRVREELRRSAPSIRLSAAVFGKYPSCRDSVGQDWAQWLREDLMDFVCPMNYVEDRSRFAQYLDDQIKHAGARQRIVTGIGVTADESRLTAPQVIDQITTARKHGLPGFVIFDLNPVVERQLLPMLNPGILSDPP